MIVKLWVCIEDVEVIRKIKERCIILMEYCKDVKEKSVECELERINVYVLLFFKDKWWLNVELESECKLLRKLKEECCDLRRRFRESEILGNELVVCFNVNFFVSMSEENRVEDFVVKIEFFEKSLCELCV